jgi:hypothetical protein
MRATLASLIVRLQGVTPFARRAAAVPALEIDHGERAGLLVAQEDAGYVIGMAKSTSRSERTSQQKSASRAQSSADKNPNGKLAREGGHRRIQSSADKQAAASDKPSSGKSDGKTGR